MPPLPSASSKESSNAPRQAVTGGGVAPLNAGDASGRLPAVRSIAQNLAADFRSSSEPTKTRLERELLSEL